jgi:hypothetical protein
VRLQPGLFILVPTHDHNIVCSPHGINFRVCRQTTPTSPTKAQMSPQPWLLLVRQISSTVAVPRVKSPDLVD